VDGSAVAPELAAANVQSLRGHAVLEALVGDRLEQLGGHAGQYVTASVARLLQTLEPIAEAGGWWCAGLDPMAGWAPMGWGCFKPDRPRVESRDDREPQTGKRGEIRGFGKDSKPLQDARGSGKVPKALKYEHPRKVPTRLFWLRVPAVVAQRVADRFGVDLPPEVAADASGDGAAFWRWWASEPRLPLLLTEGAKKAAALLSAGLPAIGAPGIWNPAPRRGEIDPTTSRRTGPPELLPELAAQPLKGRRAWVLYDHSDSRDGRRDVRRALQRIGRLLAEAGAEVLVGACPGPHKGADDHLAAGGSWEQLSAALAPMRPDPALPRLRRAQLLAPAGQSLSTTAAAADLSGRRLLASNAPMGAGKTRWARDGVAPYLAAGVPVVAPTHRTALGESQAEALGIAWAPLPGTDARLQGLGLCWDSLRPSSKLQLRPAELLAADGAGPVVVLDEIAQGIEHLLFGTGTAVAEHRPETMATTAALLRSARLTLAMDAQLSEPVLRLLERLTGESAYVIGSEHRPMAGRRVAVPQGLTARTAGEHGRGKVLELARDRRRVLVVTTAQQHDGNNAAQNLARLVRRHWPEARVLLVDSEHPEAAEQLGRDPNGTAAAHDWIIASPSITSGLSIDRPGLFDAVVVIGAGGRLPCEALAQAAARVRDPACPVWLFAPAIAPQLRIGSGDTSTARLLEHLQRCEARLLADLVGAAGWTPSESNESPWLRCWLELAAYRNQQSHAYACSIAALLELEGWAVTTPDRPGAHPLAREATADLEVIATAATAAADAAVIAAAPISAAEAQKLEQRRRLTPTERAQRDRHRIARRWGMGAAPPTREILQASRDGLDRRARFRWLLSTTEGRKAAAVQDRRRAQQLAPDGHGWAPDLVRELLSHKLAAADALGLPELLQRAGQWIAATDPAVVQLHSTAQAHAGTVRSSGLGLSPGKRPSGTLRAAAQLLGCRLEARRERCGGRARAWAYRLVLEPLPAGADPAQLAAAWLQQLGEVGHFSPLTEDEGVASDD
jgi:hypothetical protein